MVSLAVADLMVRRGRGDAVRFGVAWVAKTLSGIGGFDGLPYHYRLGVAQAYRFWVRGRVFDV